MAMTGVRKVLLVAGILCEFIVIISGSRLHCWRCSSGSFPVGCKTLNFPNEVFYHVLQQCLEGEVCYKNVVYYHYRLPNGTFTIKEHFKRGCTSYDPNTTKLKLGGCNPKQLFFPPHDYGKSCLCNDTNYCNSGNNRFKGDKNSYMVFSLIFLILANHQF